MVAEVVAAHVRLLAQARVAALVQMLVQALVLLVPAALVPVVLAAVAVGQLRAHSAAATQVVPRRVVSRSVRSVKSTNSRMHPSSAACRFLVATARRSVSARAHPSLTSLRRSTLIPQHW